jgi:hypothetical protein
MEMNQQLLYCTTPRRTVTAPTTYEPPTCHHFQARTTRTDCLHDAASAHTHATTAYRASTAGRLRADAAAS